MADMTKIGGYEAMTYARLVISSQAKWRMICGSSADHEVDGSRLINVEMAIDALEDRDEPLSETEQKLLDLCKAAEAAGLGDIVINPE